MTFIHRQFCSSLWINFLHKLFFIINRSPCSAQFRHLPISSILLLMRFEKRKYLQVNKPLKKNKPAPIFECIWKKDVHFASNKSHDITKKNIFLIATYWSYPGRYTYFFSQPRRFWNWLLAFRKNISIRWLSRPV